jgi:hypothetical protein
LPLYLGFDVTAPAAYPVTPYPLTVSVVSLAGQRLDGAETNKLQDCVLDVIDVPDPLISELACFPDKDGKLPKNVTPEFRP